MRRWLTGLMLLLVSCAALGEGPAAVRKRVEASMLVTGAIQVAPDGSVSGYTLDREDQLPPVATKLIGQSVPHWTFRPVMREGKPVAAKAKMSLRLVAKPLDDGNFTVAIRGTYFGDANTSLKRDMSARPQYPQDAIGSRVSGTVYLLLRLDRAGKVEDAFARQVDLRVIASDFELAHWRKVLAYSALRAARQWTFAPAAAADHNAYRLVRVPVAYNLHEFGAAVQEDYGKWDSYVPGPIQPLPLSWLDRDNALTGDVDALPGDGVYDQPSLTLQTPLDRS